MTRLADTHAQAPKLTPRDAVVPCMHCDIPIHWDSRWRHPYNGANEGINCLTVDVRCKDVRASLETRGITALVNPHELIDHFAGPYRMLSNFWDARNSRPGRNAEPYAVSFEWTGHMRSWWTEVLFAAAKAKHAKDRERILAAGPTEAKRLGRQIQLIDGWDDRKYMVMERCTANKFCGRGAEQAMLLGTGHADLVEGTYWRDRVWGVDLLDPERPGTNWLGCILMNHRAQIRMRRSL